MGEEITSVSVALATVIFVGDRIVTWMKAAKSNGAQAIERLETARYQERAEAAHKEMVVAQAKIALSLESLVAKLERGWCMKEKG